MGRRSSCRLAGEGGRAARRFCLFDWCDFWKLLKRFLKPDGPNHEMQASPVCTAQSKNEALNETARTREEEAVSSSPCGPSKHHELWKNRRRR